MLVLRIVAPDAPAPRTETVDASSDQILLGSGADCFVRLEGPDISERHGLIVGEDDAWIFLDVSAAGSTHNGRALRWGERSPLANGDRIGLGTIEIVVQLPEPTQSAGSTIPTPPPLTPPLTPPLAPEPPSPPKPSRLDSLLSDGGPSASVPRVRLYTAGKFEREAPLSTEGASLTIGRAKECDIVVADPFRVISKVHAKVERGWAGTFLYDLGQHGVYVNGERVENCVALSHGDRISLSLVEQGTWGAVIVYLEGEAPYEGYTPRAASATLAAGSGSESNLPVKETVVEREGAAAAAAPRRRRRTAKRSDGPDRSLLLILLLAGLALIGLLVGALFVF